jgi:hypothetical protein
MFLLGCCSSLKEFNSQVSVKQEQPSHVAQQLASELSLVRFDLLLVTMFSLKTVTHLSDQLERFQ